MQIQLSQRQEQQLIMTTDLRQSIELLQMNQMELTDFLQEQEMENPLIELEYPDTLTGRSKQSHTGNSQGSEWINQIGSEPRLKRSELLLNLEITFRIPTRFAFSLT